MNYRARRVKRRRDTMTAVREAHAVLNEVIFGFKLLAQPSLLDQTKEKHKC